MDTLERANVVPKGGAGPKTGRVWADDSRVRAIVAALPVALVVTDAQGLISAINSKAEAMFGCDDRLVIGTPVTELLGIPAEGFDAWLGGLEDIDARRTSLGPVLVARRRSGASFAIALSVARSERGECFLFIRDLTRQQEAELRLHELHAEMGRISGMAAFGTLAATFAHQLNPPLTAAVNYLDAAQAALEPAEPDLDLAREALERATGQVFRAGEIGRRLEEAVMRNACERRIESLPQLIEEASGLALIGGEQDVAVHISLDRTAEKVLADGIQVQQVLLNLIRNSLEAMESSATRDLEITSQREPGGYVRLTVADSGPGIGEEVSARLFQPFTSTKADGIGLGLAVCRSIVEAHGGRIWTEPSALGGTAFHFTLVDADAQGGRAS